MSKNNKSNNIESGIIEPEPIVDYINNPVSGVKAFNQNICLTPIMDDNINRLIVFDLNNNLKVFNKDVLQTETKLPFYSSGIIDYYSIDSSSKYDANFLGIAGETAVYVYKNLKKVIKINIPSEPINEEEKFIYKDFENGNITDVECLTKIKLLAEKISNGKTKKNEEDGEKKDDEEDNIIPLSHFTLELLTIKNKENELKYLNDNKNINIVVYNYITCINKIYKDNAMNKKSRSYLILGTEAKNVIVFDPAQLKRISTTKLKEVPVQIETIGAYENDHKIIVSDRNNSIYIIKKNDIKDKIEITQPIINFVINPKSIYLITFSKKYECYSYGNKKNYSINLDDSATNIALFHKESDDLYIIIITLVNNDFLCFREKQLIYKCKTNDKVFGIKVGTFGNIPNCVIMLGYSGAMMIKKFNNDVNLSNKKYIEPSSNDEANKGNLNVPKKTQLYLNLMEREKENFTEMQNTFQNDLLRIRYKAMDTYVKMLKIGNAPQNYSSSTTMKISASLEGLGPNFKLNLILDNVGNEPLYNCLLTLDYNRNIYIFDKENIQLSLIMPNIPIKYSLNFKNISETGASGIIKIIVVDKLKTSPLIQTTMKVPISELEML